jgi:hypothetical protein
MAQGERRRKRRRPAEDYRPPPRRGEADREEQAKRQASRPARPGAPGRPPAPWGKFPLVELVVLLSIAMLLAGFFVQGNRGVTLIGAGIALGSLAGLELAIREHFAGFRSHTTVLAGFLGVLVLGVGFFFVPAGWPRVAVFVASIVIFLGAFYLFREAFKRRSGGLGYKIN